jgi:hypothetical protein
MRGMHRMKRMSHRIDTDTGVRGVFTALLALGVAIMSGAAYADDEQDALCEQQHALELRVAALRRDQDYLVFLKRMYETDSKYLVIDLKKNTVQLRYKNRLLKDFAVQGVSPGFAKNAAAGKKAVTKKIEGGKERHALVFADAFVLRWRLSEVPRPESSLPSIVVLKKDLLSFYYTVGPGMLAFVLE